MLTIPFPVAAIQLRYAFQCLSGNDMMHSRKLRINYFGFYELRIGSDCRLSRW